MQKCEYDEEDEYEEEQYEAALRELQRQAEEAEDVVELTEAEQRNDPLLHAKVLRQVSRYGEVATWPNPTGFNH